MDDSRTNKRRQELYCGNLELSQHINIAGFAPNERAFSEIGNTTLARLDKCLTQIGLKLAPEKTRPHCQWKGKRLAG